MKTRFWIAAAAATTVMTLAGCAAGPNEQLGTGVGAVGGAAMLGEIGNVGRLHKPRVEQAGFAVLKAPDVPSILVETAFISNPQEEKRLNDEAYQQRLARAILDGIRDYIARHPPRPGSPLALN